MSAKNKSAAAAAYIPDMEDWWSEGESQAPLRQGRPRHRANRAPQPLPAQAEVQGVSRVERKKAAERNRLLMYLTLGVFILCLFLQVNRYAQIASQTKRISRLVNEIKQLENDKSNLTLRLSARENINRVREEAMYNLGMDYPTEGQVKVVALGALPPESLSQMAVNLADSAQ